MRPSQLGATLVQKLVELIVTGYYEPSQALPSEKDLSEEFRVSRTVLRESMKRLEEKGLVTVTQGRGTFVEQPNSWNILDRSVLSALIDNDNALNILDEVTAVRASLEAVMAGQVAHRHTGGELTLLQTHLRKMRDNVGDTNAFFRADADFHLALMEISGNRLAQNIARSLYRRALESSRYIGRLPGDATETTLQEHGVIVEAISRGRVGAAEVAMRAHIENGWKKRRLDPSRENMTGGMR